MWSTVPAPLAVGTWSTFQKAVAVSLLLHAGLLTVRFVAPTTWDRVLEPPPLEVVLVNARGHSKPVAATLLAQTSLEGGGLAQRSTGSKALPLEAAAPGLEFQDQAASNAVQAMRQEQNLLLAQVREQLASLQQSAVDAVDPLTAAQQEERRRSLAQQIAILEKDVAAENARPRKRFFSPSTREAVFAAYYSELRQAVERQGTQDFPQGQSGKLFGELTMAITVDAAGRVLSTALARSSGDAALDRQAQAIVRQAAPFGAFSAAIRSTADQLVFVARFRFVHTDGHSAALVD